MPKKVLKRFYQDKIPLLVLGVLLFAIFSRFIWLDKFPVGINHDEIDVALSAKAYWLFGTDISGVSFPRSLFETKTDAGLSGLPSFLLAPIIGPLKLSLLTTRLPFVILSFLTIYLLGKVVWEFTRSKQLTLIVVFVSLINPWFYFYSRSPTEAPFALLFSLVATYLLFKYKNQKIFYSLIFFIFAFFSYFGAKPVIPLLVPLLLLIHWKTIGKTRKRLYLFYLLIFFAIIGTYLLNSNLSASSTLSFRQRELIFTNMESYGKIVDEQRRASIDFPFKNIYSNKLTSLSRVFVSKYLNSWSPNYLFLEGDMMVPFEEHGALYIIDALFILLGLVSIFKLKFSRERILVYILFVYLVVGPVGSAISLVGNQYIFRAFLLIPVFIILISLGINHLFNVVARRGLVINLTFIVYFLFFINFLTFFFFRYSVKQQVNHFLGERVLANYIMRLPENSEITVIAKYPVRVFNEYVFFSNYLNKTHTLPSYETDSFIARNIKVTDDCKGDHKEGMLVIEEATNCKMEDLGEFVVIQNQKDSGSIFKIYNDKICSFYKLNPYRRSHLVSDYSIEGMDTKIFCERWINKYEN